MHHTEEDKNSKVYIRKVLEFIETNLSEDLSLGKLSAEANYSQFHFQRVFSEYVGETPKQYIIRLRLERIAHYLKMFPNLSVSELADYSGFASLSTFSRAFKNYFGISAVEYRQLSNEKYSKICKTDSKKCKTFKLDTDDLCLRDLSMDEIMSWKDRVNISVKKVKSMRLLYLSTCLNNKDAISLAYRKLCNWAAPRGLLTPETRFVGMLLDIPFITSIEKCRYWTGISVPELVKLPADASVTEIPDGLYAGYQIEGSLLSTMKSLAYLNHGWLGANGYSVNKLLGYEVYSENPANKPSETIIREMLVSVRPA
jgi:AraC family transcriptional regulator